MSIFIQIVLIVASIACLARHGSATASPAGTAIKNSKTPPVTIKGNAFFAGDTRFYLRGIDYQPGGTSSTVDPLADIPTCKRDIAKFKKLGINTIRTYAVDNTKNHNECMGLLADAGIYVAVDVGTKDISLNREKNYTLHASYNDDFLQRIFATVDLFSQYDNTLLFFSGNEVIDQNYTTWAAPYIKAVVRDVKRYIHDQGLREIPVGYSSTDVKENVFELGEYLNCGNNAASRADFYAINDYSWCYPSSYEQSGWKDKVQKWSNYGIPLFFSEYGCKQNGRTFEEVASLYGSKMSKVFSGGLAYEYSLEENGFGIVKIKSDGSITELDGFSLLEKALKNVADPANNGDYKDKGGVSDCPKPGQWWLPKNNSLPRVPGDAESYFKNGAGTPKGSQGAPKCSHWCGKNSTGFESDKDSSDAGNAKDPKAAKSKADSFQIANVFGIALAVVVLTFL